MVFCSPHVAYGRDVFHEHFRSGQQKLEPTCLLSESFRCNGFQGCADSGRGIGRKFPRCQGLGPPSINGLEVVAQGPAVIVGWKIRRHREAGKIMKIVVLGIYRKSINGNIALGWRSFGEQTFLSCDVKDLRMFFILSFFPKLCPFMQS